MEDNKKRGPGRPTDKRKDTIFRLRIDSDTQEKLNVYAKKHNLSMSQVVREAIEQIVQMDQTES